MGVRSTNLQIQAGDQSPPSLPCARRSTSVLSRDGQVVRVRRQRRFKCLRYPTPAHSWPTHRAVDLQKRPGPRISARPGSASLVLVNPHHLECLIDGAAHNVVPLKKRCSRQKQPHGFCEEDRVRTLRRKGPGTVRHRRPCKLHPHQHAWSKLPVALLPKR